MKMAMHRSAAAEASFPGICELAARLDIADEGPEKGCDGDA